MIEFEQVEKLNRDLRDASRRLSDQEARYLVDAYYIHQENRKAAANQVRALEEAGEPCELLRFCLEQAEKIEKAIKSSLDYYTRDHKFGEWLRSVTGVGPVIAAGLVAHLDITRAPTVGHFWSFAGLNPEQQWNKGQKRPYNAKLQVLCWKAGESFIKVKGNDKDVYGKLYEHRKAIETEKNLRGEFENQAIAVRERSKSKTTEAYKWATPEDRGKWKPMSKDHAIADVPMLSPGHINSRARRWAVKQFLSDLHYVMHVIEFGVEPPLPYPIEHLGHAHLRRPPIEVLLKHAPAAS